MIAAGGGVFEVGRQDAPRAVDAEEVIAVNIAALGLRQSFVMSGTAVNPPEPVDTATPGPSRLNQVSSVNVLAPDGRGPEVTC